MYNNYYSIILINKFLLKKNYPLNDLMNSKYKVIKFKKDKFENVDDFISIEEPLEISLRYKNQILGKRVVCQLR